MKIEETKKKSASGTNTYREHSFSEGDKNIRQYNNFYFKLRTKYIQATSY